jgi:four helix bundle protein
MKNTFSGGFSPWNVISNSGQRRCLRIIKLYSALPGRADAKVLGNQILRSGTSVGAHYREACRAKSNTDFISKVEGALQELDETAYWLELLGEAQILPVKRLQALHDEAEELIAILVTIATKVKRKTSKRNSLATVFS